MRTVAGSQIREKMRMSICRLVHTGYDLDFLCLESNAHTLNRCSNKRKKTEETSGQKQQFSCLRLSLGSWASGRD